MNEFSSAFSAAFDMTWPLTLDLVHHTVKFRDTHEISMTVRDAVGTPVSLTGATVRLLARPDAGGTAVVLTSALGTSQGTVTHQLTGTLAVGTHRLEVEVTLAGVITTSPSSGYATLKVVQDLL